MLDTIALHTQLISPSHPPRGMGPISRRRRRSRPREAKRRDGGARGSGARLFHLLGPRGRPGGAAPAHVSGRAAPPPPPLAAPSLRRLAFHLQIFHAGLGWRRAVCGPHKGRRVLHSSRWGPRAGGGWRGARPRGGAAAEASPGPAERAPAGAQRLRNATLESLQVSKPAPGPAGAGPSQPRRGGASQPAQGERRQGRPSSGS